MQPSARVTEFPNIVAARERSTKLVESVKRRLPPVPEDVAIIVNGSVARGELTLESDFDAYPLYRRGKKDAACKLFDLVNKNTGLRRYAEEGAFGAPVPAHTMMQKIGGQGDDNRRFTRRMLLLLESVNIGSKQIYDETLEALALRYVGDDITEKQIGRFLLNDIIRFYRTMCVDFEFKTNEQSCPKPWAIRYTKLIFSRKLIYYSGIIMCAELAGFNARMKRERLLELVRMTPIERLLRALGAFATPALTEYDNFVGLMDSKGFRDSLADVQMLRETHSPEFREIKLSGHRFSASLALGIKNTYSNDHPIHEALVL